MPVVGGWVEGSLRQLLKEDNDVIICFPMNNEIHNTYNKIEVFSFFEKSAIKYSTSIENRFHDIYKITNPDIIHIHGTEFPHALAAVNAAEKVGILDRVVISIQGLISKCSTHYYCNIPNKIIKHYSFRDFLRMDNIENQKKKFEIRGQYEIEALRKVNYIIGRTEWDRACLKQISPNALYYYCNETLRTPFYEQANAWSFRECKKHSIFVSSASYSIKGFHNVIEAVGILKNKYQDIVLYTTGRSPFEIPFYKISSYQQFIKSLIIKNNLENIIAFLGPLNEKEMCDAYLRSNVFVSSSSIENSSNSIGEAMLLGMPIVASYVGGCMDILKDKEEGLLYQNDATYMLAHYIDVIFSLKDEAKKYGEKAYAHASHTHNENDNLLHLISIYEEIKSH